MKTNTAQKPIDVTVARILILAAIVIVGIWIFNGIVWLWDWFSAASEGGNVWSNVWAFCVRNSSFLVVVYGVVCLQVSGVAELRYEKSFLRAFLLALLLTPPVMMAVYGYKRNVEPISGGEG